MAHDLPEHLKQLGPQVRALVERVQTKVFTPPGSDYRRLLSHEEIVALILDTLPRAEAAVCRLRQALEALPNPDAGPVEDRIASLESAYQAIFSLIDAVNNVLFHAEDVEAHPLLVAVLERPIRDTLPSLRQLAEVIDAPDDHLREDKPTIHLHCDLDNRLEVSALRNWIRKQNRPTPKRRFTGLHWFLTGIGLGWLFWKE